MSIFGDKKAASAITTALLVSLALVAMVRVSDTGRTRPGDGPTSQAPVLPIESLEADGDGGAALIEAAFNARISGRRLQLRGVVRRLLPDERESPRRQRLMLELSDGRMLLVSHDIEASERVPVSLGDELELFGDYEWSNRGGLVTGTHGAGLGQGPNGWIRHAGRDYR